jgi:hypothetical protein
MIRFGNPASELAHSVTAQSSDIVSGGLGESARRLLSLSPQTWEGGRPGFEMKVDPSAPNYFAARFWGSDTQRSKLVLYCEGKQIGYQRGDELPRPLQAGRTMTSA